LILDIVKRAMLYSTRENITRAWRNWNRPIENQGKRNSWSWLK